MSGGWESEFTDSEFVGYIKRECASYRKPQTIVVLCSTNIKTTEIARGSIHKYVHIGAMSTGGLKNVHSCQDLNEAKDKFNITVACIATPKSKLIHKAAWLIKRIPSLESIPIIYRVRGSETYPVYEKFDKIKKNMAKSHVFITSDFDDGIFEGIYNYSITKVPLKCQARDAHDLYQCLKNVRHIDGDIIEFGSYQGHSGLIMAEYVKRSSLSKKIYLCDTFCGFPTETIGIDRFWNNTHNCDYSGVDGLFAPYDFVNLVKGDFTKTVEHIKCDRFCFAMIDCDSYRGTKFAVNYVWPKLSAGGIVACEDYGHHVLLGARMAMDEFVGQHSKELFSFFSFFSGFRILVKV